MDICRHGHVIDLEIDTDTDIGVEIKRFRIWRSDIGRAFNPVLFTDLGLKFLHLWKLHKTCGALFSSVR
jgi:hypothetical protein